MAAVASSGVQNAHLQSQLTRSLDRILEEAQLSGELKLSGRKLKDFPSSASRYNLIDTVVADLSKNRLSEVPCALGSFPFLERLQLYHNVIRNIPSEAICALRLLTHLDLSRNQLTTLPRELCALPLKVLLISHNKLTQLPDEICRLTKLAELDASCNKLTQLPSRNFSALIQLRSLLLRDNLLTYLTVEVTTLPLERLDLRENRIGSLPIELRLMHNLIELCLDDNPLTCPPAAICKRGRVHIFKYLELEAAHRSQTRPNADVRRTLSQRSNVGLPMHINRHRRHNVDSGYSTSDGYDRRWSQEIQAGGELGPLNVSTPDGSRVSTPSTISPGGHSLSDEQGRSASSLSTTADTPSSSGPDDKTKQLPFQHIQTYKEYKEALRQQRNQDAPTAYRARTNGDAGSTPCTPTHRKSTAMASSKSDPTPLHKLTTITTPMVNGSSSPNKTVSRSPVYTKPPSPVKTCNGGLSHDNVPPGRTSAIPTRKTTTLTWNKEVPPDKLSFTMRREFDKAREESGLIEQLRSIIETRLKMSLPEDLAPALSDGVVLCHLANHVRPRSVASIHVPSPAVPKLTMARCRRNVDNFLEACRKIGIEEELLCAVEPMLRQLQVATRTFTDTVVSALCLIVFIGTVILLTLYPPPN